MFVCGFVLVPLLSETEGGIINRMYKGFKAFIYKDDVGRISDSICSNNNQTQSKNITNIANTNIAVEKDDKIDKEPIELKEIAPPSRNSPFNFNKSY